MFIKEWIELALCNLADDILGLIPENVILSAETREEIFKILSKYAEEIFLAQKETLTDEKV